MVSFRAAMPTREIADRSTITENPRPPIHRMADAICAKRTTSSRMSAMPAAHHEKVMNASTFPPPVRKLTPRVDDTEEVALGVSEDDEIFTGLARPVDGGAELKQPLDLSVRVVRVQVEVQSAPVRLHLVDGHVRPLSGRVFQNHKRVVGSGRPPRSITQGLLPEGHHLSEVVDVDHDGPDPYRALPHDADDFGDRSRRFRLPTNDSLGDEARNLKENRPLGGTS